MENTDKYFYTPCSIEHLLQIENALGDKYDLERLLDLIKADKEGRCVILPCKAGDIIYKVEYSRCHNGEYEPYSYGCCGCEDEYDIHHIISEFIIPNTEWIIENMKYFGKRVWHLNKESALKAIKGK